MNSAFATPGSSYDPLQSPRLIEFKKKIGFESALAKERQGERVVIDWSSLPAPSQLSGWLVKRDLSSDVDGTQYVRLDFTRQEEQVNISIHIFDPKANKAGELLLLKANSVTTMNITDIRGPADLGTLSLMSSAKPVDLVYWVFRNVLAEVSTYKTDVPALGIARWLQGQMELNTR